MFGRFIVSYCDVYLYICKVVQRTSAEVDTDVHKDVIDSDILVADFPHRHFALVGY